MYCYCHCYINNFTSAATQPQPLICYCSVSGGFNFCYPPPTSGHVTVAVFIVCRCYNRHVCAECGSGNVCHTCEILVHYYNSEYSLLSRCGWVQMSVLGQHLYLAHVSVLWLLSFRPWPIRASLNGWCWWWFPTGGNGWRNILYKLRSRGLFCQPVLLLFLRNILGMCSP